MRIISNKRELTIDGFHIFKCYDGSMFYHRTVGTRNAFKRFVKEQMLRYLDEDPMYVQQLIKLYNVSEDSNWLCFVVHDDLHNYCTTYDHIPDFWDELCSFLK